MIRQIRVELLKLRTTRLSYGLLATAAGLTALFAVLEAARAGGHGANTPASLSTAAGFSSVISGGVWALLLAAVLGVIDLQRRVPARHGDAHLPGHAGPDPGAGRQGGRRRRGRGAIRPGRLRHRRRGGAGVRDRPRLSGPARRRHPGPLRAGHLLAGALLAAIGVGVGSLLRSQLAGVIGVFVWTIVIESLLGGLFPAIRPYLPYTAATTLSGTSLGGAAFGPAHGVSGGTPLPFAAAAALLAALAVVLAAAAARTTVAPRCHADREAAMVPGGHVIENPLSGERITISATAARSGGSVLEWELVLAPGGRVPSSHAHPRQEECFTVLAGQMRFRVGGRRLIAGPGDTVRVPPGTVHHFANAGRQPARVAVRTRPALNMQELLETAAAMARDQHAAARRVPSLIDLALFMRDFEREVRAPYLPAALVRAVTRLLAWPGQAARARRTLPPDAGNRCEPGGAAIPMTAVEVAHLVKRYRGARRNAVDDISFDVPEGQLFCLLGPNGAGKTTTCLDPHHDARPDLGPGPDRRPGPGDRAGEGPPRTRRRLPAALARPQPDGRGEHQAARGAVRALPVAADVPPDAGRLPRVRCGSWPPSWICPTSSGSVPAPCPAACGAGWRSCAR